MKHTYSWKEYLAGELQNSIFFDKRKAVLIYIIENADETGKFFETKASIINAVGCSYMTLNKTLQILEQNKLIEILENRNNRGLIITVLKDYRKADYAIKIDPKEELLKNASKIDPKGELCEKAGNGGIRLHEI